MKANKQPLFVSSNLLRRVAVFVLQKAVYLSDVMKYLFKNDEKTSISLICVS